MDSKSLSHTKWKGRYHIVLIQKYRKKKLFGQLKPDVREIPGTLCRYKGAEIAEGAVCADHVHMCVSYSAEDKPFDFYGRPEREKYADDL